MPHDSGIEPCSVMAPSMPKTCKHQAAGRERERDVGDVEQDLAERFAAPDVDVGGGDRHDRDCAGRAAEQSEGVGERVSGCHLAAVAEAHPQRGLGLADEQQGREQPEGDPVDARDLAGELDADERSRS